MWWLCGRTGGSADSVALAEFLHVFAVGAQDESGKFVLLAASTFLLQGCEREVVLGS